MLKAVKTWADGFGVWHAEIEEDISNNAERLHVAELASEAHKAIATELLARQDINYSEEEAEALNIAVHQVNRVVRGNSLYTEYIEKYATLTGEWD